MTFTVSLGLSGTLGDYREAERYYRACALTIEAGGEHGFAGFALHVPRLLAFAGIAAEHWRHLDFSAFN